MTGAFFSFEWCKHGGEKSGSEGAALQFGAGAENVGVAGGAEDVVDSRIVFDESDGFAGEQVDVESASAEKRE